MKSQKKSNLGIKDIALKANVSIGTVDRVLHNRGEVSDATRQKVLKIIEDLDYTPNILAQSLSSKKKHTIAALIPDYKYDNPYWENALTGIYKAAKEINNFNFEIEVFTYELGNEQSVTEQSAKIFKSKPDGLIFAPLMYEVSIQVIAKCEELNIPYIFIDVNIDDCQNLTYFGQNPKQSGAVAARLLDLGLPEGAEIHIIKLVNQSVSSYHLNLRESGFLSYFSSKENKQSHPIISSEINISSKATLENDFKRILKPSESPKGIFIPNSRGYHVAKYLYDSNQMHHFLIGYDLLAENVDYLKKGTIQFLICQNPDEQGYNSVMAFFNFLTYKRSFNKCNFSPIDIILKENIDFYKSNIPVKHYF